MRYIVVAMVRKVEVNPDRLEAICRRHGVARLSFFGSVLREDFDPSESDVDVLVEFEPDVRARLTYFAIGALREDLEALIGRTVDLSIDDALDPRLRDRIIDSAELQYGRA